MSRYGEGNTYAFDNFPEARKWASADGKEWERGLLLGSHLEALNQIYGAPTGRFKGSEHQFSVWTLDHDGLIVHLLSAEGKGCCMEVELPAGATPWTREGAAIGSRLPSFLDKHLAAMESVLGKRPVPGKGRKFSC